MALTYAPVIAQNVNVEFSDLKVNGTLEVVGATTLDSTLNVSGNSTFANASVGGTLAVSGNTTLAGVTVTSPSSMNTINAAQTTVTSLIVNTANQFQVLNNGTLQWGDGTNAPDTSLVRAGVNALQTSSFLEMGAGKSDGLFSVFGGLHVAEGSNATMGVVTLVTGSATVNTTKVTANSRIFLTVQELGTVSSPKAVAAFNRTPGTSFQIASSDATDTSNVAWFIVEPAS